MKESQSSPSSQQADTPQEAAQDVFDDLRPRLIEFREAHGLTQTALAASANVSRGFVHRMEKGEVRPSLAFLIVVARTYNISLDWLLFGKGSMSTEGVRPEEVLPGIARDVQDARNALIRIKERLRQAGVKDEN